MIKNIAHNWFMNQPPEQVWEYLTDTDLITQWLMKNDFEPVVGHQFRFYAQPLPQMDFDGNIYCTVLEITPFSRLSYSWKGGPGNGVITLDSIVLWTLIPKDGGTELRLEHSGFKETDNMMMYAAMDAGWSKIVQKIGSVLNERYHGTVQS